MIYFKKDFPLVGKARNLLNNVIIKILVFDD